MISFTKKKTHDWRYQTCELLNNKEVPVEATIYWIGVFDLIDLEEDKTMYPLGSQFLNNEVQNDQYQRRDVDGDPKGFCTTLYDFSAIMDYLVIARDHHGNSCHFFLEEKVDQHGKHTVNIIHEEENSYGWTRKAPWYYEQVKDWLQFCSYTITEKTKRLCILSQKRYNWLK